MKYKKPCAVMLAVLYASSLSTPGILRDAITAQVEAAEAGDTDDTEAKENSIGYNVIYNGSSYTIQITGSGAMEDYSSASDVPWMESLNALEAIEITAVEISEDITHIGANAFNGFTGLTTVTGGTVSIGDNAFAGCTSLENVNLDITTASVNAFSSCTTLDDKDFTYKVVDNEAITDSETYYSLEVIKPSTGEAKLTVSGTGSMLEGDKDADKLPWWDYHDNIVEAVFEEGITYVPTRSFDANYKNLRSVTLPETLESIGDYAFAICEGLTGEFKIPEGVTSLGQGVFAYSNISEVHLPDGVTELEYRLFDNCQKLETVTMSDNVTRIGSMAFGTCPALKSFTFPSALTIIESSAFRYCTSLQTVNNFPANVSIGYYAFSGCTLLSTGRTYKEGTLDDNGEISYKLEITKQDNLSMKLTITGSGAMPDFEDKSAPWYSNRNNIKSIEFSDDITSISKNAFSDCGALTSVTLPTALTSVGESAFSGCTKLTSVEFTGENTKTIANYAFSDCTSLTSVTGLTDSDTIAKYAFNNCTSLTSGITYEYESGTVADGVTYTLTVTNPATMAMKLVITTSNSYITMPDYSDTGKTPWSDYATNITEVEFTGSGSGDYTNLWGLIYIGANSFNGCTNLSKVTVKDGGMGAELSIGDYAFYNCPSLESVQWNSIYKFTVGAYAFNGCTNFTGFKSKWDSCLNTCTIGDYAFENCTSISTALPENYDKLTLSVGKGAFLGCTNLTTVCTFNSNYGGSISSVSISDESFMGCSSLTTAYFGSYNGDNTGASAYEGCSSLTTVTIPSGMTTIPYAMFRNCTGLTTVSGSENVTSVADYAFDGCSSLSTYTANESLTGEINSFKGTQLSDITYDFRSGNIDDNFNYKLEVTNVSDPEMILTISGTGEWTENDMASLMNSFEDTWIQYITKVVIEDGVTAIGDGAFSDIKNLASVVIPESVKRGSIADTAFEGCPLTDIDYTIASGSCGNKANYVIKSSKLDGTDQTVTISGTGKTKTYSKSSQQPWADNQQLITSVVVEDGVTSVGSYMFADCVNLSSVTLADSVDTIGRYAFANCTALTGITIPDGVEEIPVGAFENCTSLTDVNITDDVCIIGENAFKDCTSLVTITLPSSLESIGDSTFENCTSLETVVVNDSLTSVGSNAFKNCVNLTTINVSEKATVDDTAFDGCTSLTGVKYEVIAGECGADMTYTLMITEPATNTMTLYINGSGDMYDYNSATDVPWLAYADQITAVEFEDNTEDAQFITKVGAYAFNGLDGLTSVALPTHNGTVFTVGDYAFADCTNLETVSGDITTVGASAFENCTALTSISIDESLPVGEDAFANCASLTDITYTVAKGNSGSASYSLVCTNPSESTMVLTISGKGAMADYTHSTTPWDKYSEDIVEIIIEDGVTTVGDKAFSACTNLETISIPATVSKVNEADVNTSALENITYVVQNETKCGTRATYTITSDRLDKTNQKLVISGTGATKLVDWGDSTDYITEVEVKDGITKIASGMFKGCTALTDVTLPSSIRAVNENAFESCTSLKSIDLPSGVYIATESFKGCTALETIAIPNGATVEESAFEGCSGLTEVTMPNSLQTIKSKTFKDCTSLTTVNFGDNLTTIAEEAFMGCTALSDLTIPSSVTSIGDSSFSGCTSLTEVVIPETVASVGKNLFAGCTSLTSVRYNHYETATVADLGVADDILKSINVIGDSRIEVAIERGYLDNENTVEFDIRVDTNSFGGNDDALYLDGVKVVINEKEYSISECYEDEDGYIVFPVVVTVTNSNIESLAIRGQVDAKNDANETVTLYFASKAENVER